MYKKEIKEVMRKKGYERQGCRNRAKRGQNGGEEGCPSAPPPLFETSKGFITLPAITAAGDHL